MSEQLHTIPENCKFPSNCEGGEDSIEEIFLKATRSIEKLGCPLSEQARIVFGNTICSKCGEIVPNMFERIV